MFKAIIATEKYKINLKRKRLEMTISLAENWFRAKTVDDAAIKEKRATGNTNFLGKIMAILLNAKYKKKLIDRINTKISETVIDPSCPNRGILTNCPAIVDTTAAVRRSFNCSIRLFYVISVGL